MADNDNPANNVHCATAAVSAEGVGSDGPEMIGPLPTSVEDVPECSEDLRLPRVADTALEMQ